MEIIPIKTRIFLKKESLTDFLIENLSRLKEGDVVVITSKIIALSQGRVVPNLPGIKKKWIKKESKKVIETPWGSLTLKNGDWCVNAGIDESNANNQLILLPKNPFGLAEKLKKHLSAYYGLKKIGVLITDSRTVPLRAGVIGLALAYAGFFGFKDYRGQPDLFGRKLKMTKSNIVDALAAAAVSVMGEGREQTPLALIRQVPLQFSSKRPSLKKLLIKPQNDIYRKVFL